MSSHEEMHGPTARESRMIELDDAGWSVSEIAEHMNLNQDYVLARLKGLSVNDTARDLAFFDMSRRGTEQLGRAVIAAGGHR